MTSLLIRTLCVAALAAGSTLAAALIDPVPADLASDRFHVTVSGRESPVAHAATTYYFLNFSIKGTAEISVTSDTEGYWDKGVEVQPWRWGIRPAVKGRTITFSVAEPMKLSISRPGDHGAGAEMLFLFANAPEVNRFKPGDAGVRYYGPGTHRESITAKSGDIVYLAPGAVVFGALNLWGVENVKVFGRGTIVYDGPQNPDHDEGWMHKPDWHAIVMDHARNIRISGITAVVRSRTWMIQMLSSRNVTFDNVKVIGGCPGNANQDGMDWLGGGDTIIRDSFFRASDDIFALYGNWLGYGPDALTTPGETVDNILIENSVLSTSISNVVRVSWPGKVFDSHHFTMRNSDVIHMGMGGCKVPFGLLEIWDEPGGKGNHSDYAFENIRLEDWYSLLQLRRQNPGLNGVTLKDVWALDSPPLVPSVISGNVTGVSLENVPSSPANNPGDGPHASFHFSPGMIKPGAQAAFDASASTGLIAKYEWIFGDGTRAQGKKVRHAFADSRGTLNDASGRFRVFLKVTGAGGHEDWASLPVVVTNEYMPALADQSAPAAGLQYRYYEGHALTLSGLADLTPVATGATASFTIPDSKRPTDYAVAFDGTIDVPADGGYTFLLLGNDAAELAIDARVIATSPHPKPQVCGMVGNMVQMTRATVGLKAGRHSIHAAMTHSLGPDGFAIEWQGPGLAQERQPL